MSKLTELMGLPELPSKEVMQQMFSKENVKAFFDTVKEHVTFVREGITATLRNDRQLYDKMNELLVKVERVEYELSLLKIVKDIHNGDGNTE